MLEQLVVSDWPDETSVQPAGVHEQVTAAVDVVDVVDVDVVVVVVVVVVQLLAATALHVYVPQTDMKIPHRTVHEAEQSLFAQFVAQVD